MANRLRWAMNRHDWREGRRRGLRLFQKRMDERAKELEEAGGPRLEGVSKSSIQTYLSGKVVPPLPFLQAAARVLGLREAWLISGDGFATEEENAAAAKGQGKPGLLAIGKLVLEAQVADLLEKGEGGFWDLPDATREAMLRGYQSFSRIVFVMQPGRYPDEEALRQKYASYLSAPFAILGIDRASLEPIERALLIDALLRSLDIVQLASRRRSWLSTVERTGRDKAPAPGWPAEMYEPDRTEETKE